MVYSVLEYYIFLCQHTESGKNEDRQNKQIGKNDAIFCDCDEDLIANHFCKECSAEDHTEFLCKKCVNAHKIVRVTRAHCAYYHSY